MDATKRKYLAWEKEALAVFFALEKYSVYLRSPKSFVVFSDQQSLRLEFTRKNIQERLAHWIDSLAKYEFEVCSHKSSLSGRADFLFRVKHSEQEVDGCEERELLNLIVYGAVFKKCSNILSQT